MIRRIFKQPLELMRDSGISELLGPEFPHTVFRVTNHVEERSRAEHGPVEVWPLNDGRAHDETAVGSAEQAKPVRCRPARLDQPFRGGVEVRDGVLLVLRHAGPVPRFPALAAAAEAGYRVNAAGLHPCANSGRIIWLQRCAKPAIACEE